DPGGAARGADAQLPRRDVERQRTHGGVLPEGRRGGGQRAVLVHLRRRAGAGEWEPRSARRCTRTGSEHPGGCTRHLRRHRMSMTTRLVQLVSPGGERLVSLVDEPLLRIIDGYASVYELALAALAAGEPLPTFAQAHVGGRSAPYDDVWEVVAGWRVLPAIDHPIEPARCLISGTG